MADAKAAEEVASKVAGDTAEKAFETVVTVLIKLMVAAVVTMVAVRAVGVQRLGEEKRADEQRQPRIEVAVGAQLPVVVVEKTKRLGQPVGLKSSQSCSIGKGADHPFEAATCCEREWLYPTQTQRL